LRNGAQSKASVPIVRPISYNHIRPYGTGGTRPFHLWRTWGPSVQDPIQLLRLAMTFSPANGQLIFTALLQTS